MAQLPTPTIKWVSRSGIVSPLTKSSSTATTDRPDTLYMYLDESGNFDFSERGSRYFIMTCIAIKRPFGVSHTLMDYRYDCLESGTFIDKFHACEDVNKIRAGVYQRIAAHGDKWHAYSISIEKSCVPDNMKTASSLYSEVFSWIVEEVYKNECLGDIEKAVVITDSLPKEARKRDVEGPLKSFMKAIFQSSGIDYSLMHHPSNCDPNLQLADYACWAFHRKLTLEKEWPYSVIENSFVKTGTIEIKSESE